MKVSIMLSLLIPTILAQIDGEASTASEGIQFSSGSDIHGELVKANLCDENIVDKKKQLIYKCIDDYIPIELTDLVTECGKRLDSKAETRDGLWKLICVNPGVTVQMDKCLHELWKKKNVDQLFTTNQLITIGMKYLQCYQKATKNE